MSEANKALIRRLIDEVWNQAKLLVLDEIVSADFVRHVPSWPEEILGPEGFKQYVSAMHNAFRDCRLIAEDVLAEGDKVVVRWKISGTHVGNFMGISPTGKRLTLTGISISQIQDGKIVSAWDGYDALGLLHDLGVLP